MGKQIGVVVVVALMVAGCGFLSQARTDYQLGKSTPIAAGEISPQAAAEGLVDPLLPFIPEPLKPAAGIVVGALALLGTFRRGRRIRKGLTPSANPITGTLGAKTGLEGGIQGLASLATGVFDVGAAGSGLKRGWKVLIAAAIPGLLLMVPAVKDLVAQNAEVLAGYMAIVTALVLGIEKELKKVLPVKTD